MGRWTQRARELRTYDDDSSSTIGNMPLPEAPEAAPAHDVPASPTAPEAAANAPRGAPHLIPIQQPQSPRRRSREAESVVARLLPPFWTVPRQTVFDTVQRLQAENGGALVTFDEIEAALAQTMTHTQIATALTAVVEGHYVMRYGRWQTLVWRYGIADALPSTAADDSLSEHPITPAPDPADEWVEWAVEDL